MADPLENSDNEESEFWLGVGASTSVWQWVLVMSQSGNSACFFTSNPQSQRVFFPLNTHNVTLWLFIHEKEQNIKGTLRLAATHRVTCSAPVSSPCCYYRCSHIYIFILKLTAAWKTLGEWKSSSTVDPYWGTTDFEPSSIFTIVNSDWCDIYSYYK